jgi:hypothetical protein
MRKFDGCELNADIFDKSEDNRNRHAAQSKEKFRSSIKEEIRIYYIKIKKEMQRNSQRNNEVLPALTVEKKEKKVPIDKGSKSKNTRLGSNKTIKS